MADTCATCDFRHAAPLVSTNNAAVQDECRRFPPMVVALPVMTVRGMALAPTSGFPAVDAATHYCGEHTVTGNRSFSQST